MHTGPRIGMAVLAVLSVSLLLMTTCTSAPPPTYTPYPTYTPVPMPTQLSAPPGQPTYTPYPTYTPFPSPTPTSPPTPTPTAAPKPVGELKIGMSDLSTEALDPMLGGVPNKFYLSQMYDALVGVDRTGTKVDSNTGVASKWETAPDNTSITFYIRQGIKFHNGDDLTAEDVKFSLERIMSPKSLAGYASSLRSAIKEMVVVDPYKLTLNFKSPTLGMEVTLSELQGGTEPLIVPKNYIQKNGDAYFNAHPIGSGPYQFDRHVYGAEIRLKAVDRHWLVGVPKYQYLSFAKIPQEATLLALAKTGNLDIIGISRASIAEAKAGGLSIWEKPAGSVVGVYFNATYLDPLTNKNIRQAMNISIDRGQILKELLLGAGEVVGSFPLGSYAAGYAKLPPYPFDPQKATQLLAEAGYTKDHPFEVSFYTVSKATFPEGQDVGLAMASYWEKVGIKVKVVPTDYGLWRDTFSTHKFPAGSLSGPIAVANQPFVAATARAQFHSKGSFSYVQDIQADALVDKFTAAKSMTEYGAATAGMNQYVYDTFYNIPLFELSVLWAAGDKVKQWDLGKCPDEFNFRALYWTP